MGVNENLDNHQQLVCTNNDEVHKSEVDPPPHIWKKWLWAACSTECKFQTQETHLN